LTSVTSLLLCFAVWTFCQHGRVLRRFPFLALLLALALAVPAVASGAAGDLGNDVSYPNCGSALPVTGTFGIVGVDGGRAFSANSCLDTESAWAATKSGTPGLYVNTGRPAPADSTHWPTTASGPAPCRDASSTTDMGCAYDYGWAAAADSLSRAQATVTAFDPLGVTWWLDVETANSWVQSGGVGNTAALQGEVDSLRTAGVPTVGVYSAQYSWQSITGGFTTSNAADYRSQWAASFQPKYPLEQSPTWVAGVGTADDAAAKCGTQSFLGTLPRLAQFADGSFDGDRQCADPAPDTTAPTASITGPTTTTSLDRAPWTWSSPDTDVASYDWRYRVAGTASGFGAYAYPGSLQQTTSRSVTQALAGGHTYCASVRARDTSGNLGVWSREVCTSDPLDDRSLTASSGWARGTASGRFRSTYTQTTTARATLRVVVQARRLALVVTTCNRCGRVTVYVNSTPLATVSLYAPTTRLKQVLLLPTYTLRSATIVVKALDAGRIVQIDGLAASRV
jgi:hypothetical protein